MRTGAVEDPTSVLFFHTKTAYTPVKKILVIIHSRIIMNSLIFIYDDACVWLRI